MIYFELKIKLDFLNRRYIPHLMARFGLDISTHKREKAKIL